MYVCLYACVKYMKKIKDVQGVWTYSDYIKSYQDYNFYVQWIKTYI